MPDRTTTETTPATTVRFDDRGRIIPFTPEERKAQREAALALLAELAAEPPAGDAAEDLAILRSIDENRAPGRKLFAEYY